MLSSKMRRSSNKNIKPIHNSVILIIVLFAFFVRTYPFTPVSLWLDETIEYHVANRPIREVVQADRDLTHDPPLFSLLLGLWMKVGKTDVYLKMLSVFFSVLATAIIFTLGRYSANIWAGYLAAFITAVAPRSVYYGQEVNQYALVLLFATLCPFLLERYFSVLSLIFLDVKCHILWCQL